MFRTSDASRHKGQRRSRRGLSIGLSKNFLAGLTTVPLLQGFAARATGGLTATFAGGGQLSAGSEYEGIGGNTQIWT